MNNDSNPAGMPAGIFTEGGRMSESNMLTEIDRLRAQRDELLAACKVAYKFARGKHSTFTYWPKNICNQLAAAIEAGREKP